MLPAKRILKFSANTLKKIIHKLDKRNVVFSIGENCLTDDLLSRNNLKSFSSPYSTGRSNIEYILAFEREEFRDLLNPQYLRYENDGEVKVVRNIKYVSVQNKYNLSVANGVEFTHHDVLGNDRVRSVIMNRCNRLKTLKNKHVVMVYHHRRCDQTDLNALTKNLSELAEIYKERGNSVHIFLFTQILVSDQADRRVEKSTINGISVFLFYTGKEWMGGDKEIFFARCDDDLLKEMIEAIRDSMK